MERFRSTLDDYPFVRSDGGRTQSHRPKQKNDCTVRAIVHATLVPYDIAYDMLAVSGRMSHQGFGIDKWFASDPLPGYCFRKVTFPFIKGEQKMTPAMFARHYTKGVFIVETKNHVFTFRDGIAYDTRKEDPNCCIYEAWEVTRS